MRVGDRRQELHHQVRRRRHRQLGRRQLALAQEREPLQQIFKRRRQPPRGGAELHAASGALQQALADARLQPIGSPSDTCDGVTLRSRAAAETDPSRLTANMVVMSAKRRSTNGSCSAMPTGYSGRARVLKSPHATDADRDADDQVVNFRTGPGTQHPTVVGLTDLQPGSVLAVLGVANGCYAQLQDPNTALIGYSDAEYLNIETITSFFIPDVYWQDANGTPDWPARCSSIRAISAPSSRPPRARPATGAAVARPTGSSATGRRSPPPAARAAGRIGSAAAITSSISTSPTAPRPRRGERSRPSISSA